MSGRNLGWKRSGRFRSGRFGRSREAVSQSEGAESNRAGSYQQYRFCKLWQATGELRGRTRQADPLERVLAGDTCSTFSSCDGRGGRWGDYQCREYCRLSAYAVNGGLWRFKGIHPFLLGGVVGREPEHSRARPRALPWPSGHRILRSVRRRRTGCDEPQGYNRKHRKYGTPSVGSWARPCDFRKSVLLLAGAIRPVCITLGFGQDKRKDSPPVYITR
jgi:hypothetical protein